MNFNDPETLGPIIGIAIVAVVIGFRLMRGQKQRPLKVEWMWVRPLVLVALAGMLIWQFPPHGLEWLWLAVAFAAGAGLGWQRGRMMAISVDPETHALNQRASPAAMLFLLALVAFKLGARSVFAEEAGLLDVSADVVTDLLVVFAVGLIGVTQLEMYVRARKLLDDARAAGKVVS